MTKKFAKKTPIHKQVTTYLKKDTVIKGVRIPRSVIAGVFAVVLLYVSVASIVSLSAPWLLKGGDTVAHIDYVWRLYNGELPNFYDGVQYHPFSGSDSIEGIHRSIQSAAAHPPLFYLLHAIFIGPILNTGNWALGIAIGRFVNIGIGVLCILSLAWAGWVFGGKIKEALAISVPAIGALISEFTFMNFNYANDGLLVLFSTLALTLSYKLLKKGPDRRNIILLSIVSALGMATKATYILILGISLLAVLGSFLFNSRKNSFKKEAFKGVMTAAAIGLLTLVAIGWFYYFWNYNTNGRWYSPSPSTYTGGREFKSTIDVLISRRFWNLLLTEYAAKPAISISITNFAIAGFLMIKLSRVKRILKDKKALSVLALLSFTVAGALLIQLVHGTGYGAITIRYLLPALLPISLFLAYGLLQFKQLKGGLVYLAVAGLSVSTLSVAIKKPIMVRSISNLNDVSGIFDMYVYAMGQNGLPFMLLIFLLGLFVLGFTILAPALLAATDKNSRS